MRARHASRRPFFLILRRLPAVVIPALAVAASFMPWITLTGPGAAGAWNVYQFGPFAWIWLAAAVAAAGAFLWRPQDLRVRQGWLLLAGVSAGVGLSGLVFVQVAGAVSNAMSVPIPIALDAGAPLFAAASVLWVLWGLWKWPDRPRNESTATETALSKRG